MGATAPIASFDAAGGYGASLTVRRTWGVADPVAEKDRVLDYYRRLNTDILSHFAGCDNFLSLDLTRDPAWSALCAFLERPVPHEPFPHQNRGDGGEPSGGAVGARGRHVDMFVASHGALLCVHVHANNA